MIPILIYNSVSSSISYQDESNNYYFQTSSIESEDLFWKVKDNTSGNMVTYFPKSQVIYSIVPLSSYLDSPISSSYSEFRWNLTNTNIEGDLFYLNGSSGYIIYQDADSGEGYVNLNVGENYDIEVSGSSINGNISLKNINSNSYIINDTWTSSYSYSFTPEYGITYELVLNIISSS